MENLGLFCDHLVYLTAIGNILKSFGIFCCHLANVSPFWYFVPRKIWHSWYYSGVVVRLMPPGDLLNVYICTQLI
jgi:hypothetical protein